MTEHQHEQDNFSTSVPVSPAPAAADSAAPAPVAPAHPKSGLSTAALVLGIIGICLSFIPIINYCAFILGVLALVFGIIGAARGAGRGKAVAGLILGILSVVITIYMKVSVTNAVGKVWNDAVDDLQSSLGTMTGENTEQVLKNNLDVTFGRFTAKEDTFFTTTELTVTLQNKSKDSRSFSVDIEAVSDDGTRITTDTVYVSSLGAGQKQNFKAFTLVSSDMVDALKKASFRVVSVSMI